MHIVVEFVRTLIVAFVTLFPVVNPIGDAPIFLSLTRQYPESVQRVLARKIAAYGFVILAVSLLIGTEVLAFLGIKLFVVQIAGGLIVASTGWSLLNQQSVDAPASEPATLEDALKHAFYPLTMPLSVGPGSISIAITIGAHLRPPGGSIFSRAYLLELLAALTGMALLCFVIAVCYGSAERLVRKLGKSGTDIMIRLSAFFLFAIGVQILWNGLSSGWPLLKH
ncbi:MAG: MarC family protein [Silvibacterium sp.]|nr:MarC family protein [Silvibacterium sp.]MBV8435961.1 MarC family protein [Silvibacterium sp.]